MRDVIQGHWNGEDEVVHVTCEADCQHEGRVWFYMEEEIGDHTVGFIMTPEQAGKLIKIIRTGLRETKEREREREKYETMADGIG